MTVSLVGASNNDSKTVQTSAPSIATPANTAVGDVMLLLLTCPSSVSTVTPPSGWTTIYDVSNATPLVHTVALCKTADATDAAGTTYTFTLGSTVRWAVAGASFRGVQAVVDVSNTATRTSNTSIVSPTVAVNNAGEAVVHLYSARNATGAISAAPDASVTEASEASNSTSASSPWVDAQICFESFTGTGTSTARTSTFSPAVTAYVGAVSLLPAVPTVNSAATVAAAHSPASVGDSIAPTVNASWTPPTGASLVSYRRTWQSSTDGGATWPNTLSGPTSSGTYAGLPAYTVQTSDYGALIRAVDAAADAVSASGWSANAVSNSITVQVAPPVATSGATVTAAHTPPQVGDSIIVSSNAVMSGTITTYERRAQRSTDSGATWADVAGATYTGSTYGGLSTYTVVSGDSGYQLRYAERASNSTGTSAWVFSNALTVLAPPDWSSAAVIGAAHSPAQVGDAINVNTAAVWIGSSLDNYERTIQRSTNGGSTWSTISGPTTSTTYGALPTYTVLAGDVGQMVRYADRAHNAAGWTTLANSNAVTISSTVVSPAATRQAARIAAGTELPDPVIPVSVFTPTVNTLKGQLAYGPRRLTYDLSESAVDGSVQTRDLHLRAALRATGMFAEVTQ